MLTLFWTGGGGAAVLFNIAQKPLDLVHVPKYGGVDRVGEQG